MIISRRNLCAGSAGIIGLLAVPKAFAASTPVISLAELGRKLEAHDLSFLEPHIYDNSSWEYKKELIDTSYKSLLGHTNLYDYAVMTNVFEVPDEFHFLTYIPVQRYRGGEFEIIQVGKTLPKRVRSTHGKFSRVFVA